jgi:hypothetical protein
MIFPVSFKYKRTLRGIITPDQQAVAIQVIKKMIVEKKGKNIVVENNSVSYKGTTAPGKGSLLGAVDNGKFSLIDANDKSLLIYEINMQSLFITTGIMAVVAGVFVQRWWVSLIAFAWLCGMNWVIILIRHDNLVLEVAASVNDLIFGKEEVKEEEKVADDGKLKSWM